MRYELWWPEPLIASLDVPCARTWGMGIQRYCGRGSRSAGGIYGDASNPSPLRHKLCKGKVCGWLNQGCLSVRGHPIQLHLVRWGMISYMSRHNLGILMAVTRRYRPWQHTWKGPIWVFGKAYDSHAPDGVRVINALPIVSAPLSKRKAPWDIMNQTCLCRSSSLLWRSILLLPVSF